jgi:hypothetical protein
VQSAFENFDIDNDDAYLAEDHTGAGGVKRRECS